MFALCRYVSETGWWFSITKRGWEEERKNHCDMAWYRMWRNRTKMQGEWARVRFQQDETERKNLLFWSVAKNRCPRNCRGQPNWLKWRGRLLSVMVCNVLICWIFFLCFFICCAFWYWINLNKVVYWINLNKVVYWINSNKVAYWINSNKVAQVHKINSKNTQFYLVLISSTLHYILPKYVVSSSWCWV